MILHWASKYGHPDCVKFLLESKADPNVKDKDGKTPLHLASRRLDCLKLLLESKAANQNANDIITLKLTK